MPFFHARSRGATPVFWTYFGALSRMLLPLSWVVTALTAHRVANAGWRAPVPVLCCGNATVGGAGKTTLALDLARRLNARGIAVHVLLRGYRGTVRGPRRVAPGDDVSITGDEALLQAEVAPTWIGADRAASARAAINAGAEVLLMDDGLQNPSLEKTVSLLVIDGLTGFGNGQVLPAGPLREPVLAAASRCRAAVLIGPDTSGALAQLPPDLPVMRAETRQGTEIASLTRHRVYAFAGIAHPNKFFTALERNGITLVGRESFPDHHVFTATELARIEKAATALDAVLVTTPKDAVRLPADLSVKIVSVSLVWDNDTAIDALLDELVGRT